MTAVTRVLPRYWDGRRLLRFLTGLAMLALAFTVHVTPPAPALPATPVASVAAVSPRAMPAPSSDEPVAALPALRIETPLVIGSAVTSPLVSGAALRVRAERAPPSA